MAKKDHTREDAILAMRRGSASTALIAKAFDISAERVRQILKRNYGAAMWPAGFGHDPKPKKLRGVLLRQDEVLELLDTGNVAINCDLGSRKVGDLHEFLFVKEGFQSEHPLAIQEGRRHGFSTAGIPGPPKVTYRTIYRADGDPLAVYRTRGWPYFSTVDEAAVSSSNFERCGGGRQYHWRPAVDMTETESSLLVRIEGIDTIGWRAQFRLKRQDGVNKVHDGRWLVDDLGVRDAAR